jgi:hypothetical protein
MVQMGYMKIESSELNDRFSEFNLFQTFLCNFDLLMSFPNILTMSHFLRIF